MWQLEQAVLQIRQRLHCPPEDGLLVQYRPMAEPASTQVDEAIERMLAEIHAIAEEFDLQATVEDVGSYVVAQTATAWADLVDMVSPRLKRHGPVAPSLRETLDPHIQALIELAREIGEAATGEPEGNTEEQ